MGISRTFASLAELTKALVAGGSLAICATEIMQSLSPGGAQPYWSSTGLIETLIKTLGLNLLFRDIGPTTFAIAAFLTIASFIVVSSYRAFRRNAQEYAELTEELAPKVESVPEPKEPNHSDAVGLSAINAFGVACLFIFGVPFAPILAGLGAAAIAAGAAQVVSDNAKYEKERAEADGRRKGQSQATSSFTENALDLTVRKRRMLRLSLVTKFSAMFILVGVNYSRTLWS